MFKFLPRAFAALALALAPAAHAQTAQDADPALWVVKDHDTTIYLFGTVHVLKPGLSWFDEAVKDAFDKSDQVMLEIVEPDPAVLQGLIAKIAYNPTGPGVTEQLPESKRAAYVAALASLGVPAEMLDRLDPWFPAITLSYASLTKYGYDPESGAEKVLAAAAKEAGKPVAGLETAEQQLGYFDSLPKELQVKFLVITIDQLPRMGTMIDTMMASWSKGDSAALGALLNEELDETPEIAKVLLTERNARWAEWIEKRMEQPGTVFVAVGAGHLAGPGSVQEFLEKHRLNAERIEY